jgi:HEAT repeat protein
VNGKKASAWIDTLVNGNSARQRALAVEALAKLWTEKRHKEAIKNIGRALRVDTSPAVRVQAAIALGGLREQDIKEGYGVEDLVDAMGKEKESRVRLEIARAIGRFPVVAKLAVVPLTAALKDPDAATRAAVAEAVGLAGTEAKSAAAGLAPLLSDQDKGVRKAVVIAMGRIAPEGASAVAEVMAKMLDAEKDTDIRVELVTSIQLLGEKSPPVVAALAKLLLDPEDDLRRRSARALGTFGVAAQPAADTLYKVAATDKLKDIRVDAVRAFGMSVGPTELKGRVKDLIALLNDPEFEVRLAVVDEIGSLGNDLIDDKDTIKVLRTRLSDPHLKVREAVVLALRKIEKKPEPKKDTEPPKSP